jgi:AcrR family transcriptional regulator
VPRPKLRTPELAETVLEAGLRLLTSEGVGSLTARRLAAASGTSPAAIYELFGDKAGVVRAMFFTGFERLGEELGEPDPRSEPLEALRQIATRYRAFINAHPAWAALMFSRPFASFDPAPDEQAAGAAVRSRIVDAVKRAVDEGDLYGDPIDISHAFVSIIQGLAAAESSQRLGRSPRTIDRRWRTAIDGLLRGFASA